MEELHSFLTLAPDGCGQLHAPATLLPDVDPWYPLNRLGGIYKRSGHCGTEEKDLCPSQVLNPAQ
jgi:hypothetical protein